MNAERGGMSRSKMLAIEAGAAGVGMAVAGTATYLAYRRRRAENQRHYDPEHFAGVYDKNLKIFAEEKLSEPYRRAMAAVAVRIFHATHASSEGVITKIALLEQMSETDDPELQLTSSTFNDVIGRLKQHNLVERRPNNDERRKHGYAAMPSLEWGLQGDYPLDILAQAHADLINDNS